jgi:glyoxylase-like metal-dependent hydrolase (beta-lactamase superfamily II)
MHKFDLTHKPKTEPINQAPSEIVFPTIIQPKTMISVLDLNFLGSSKTIASYLIDDGEHRILVDCGPFSTWDKLVSELARFSLQPQDIDVVLLTHIHFDHAGAAWALAQAGAEIWVHPAGYTHLAKPEKLYNSAKRIYGDRMEMLWGAMEPIAEGKLRQIEDGEVMHVGDHTFEGHYTPGHAVHHIAWKYGDALFTGDAAGICIVPGIISPPCPPPDIHIGDWLESIAKMKALKPEKLYLAHFGEWNYHPDHFDQLETALLDWSNWIKPYAVNQTPIEDIVPDFVAFVRKSYLDRGINEDWIARYEKANPAYMSVAGLMRFWKVVS